MGKDVCETILVRKPDGQLIKADCASVALEIVQAWEADHPGVPLTVHTDSTSEGPVLHFGIVEGPLTSAKG